ncbi:hypothetical protein QE152_g40081 [Popillia japonica]|uniref:Uncharacterized protein n=1 Tax=Popillia japonica TaxID=7064 RepID=A0AAW1HSK4_POPJA
MVSELNKNLLRETVAIWERYHYNENGIRTEQKFIERNRRNLGTISGDVNSNDKFPHSVNVSSKAKMTCTSNVDIMDSNTSRKSRTNIKKHTSCDMNVQSYQEIRRGKKDYDTHICKSQHLANIEANPAKSAKLKSPNSKIGGKHEYQTRSKSTLSSPESPKTCKQNIQAENLPTDLEGHAYRTRSKSALSSPQSPKTSKLANQPIGTVGHISRKRSKSISRSLQIPKTSKENIQTENQPPYFEVHTYRTRSKSASSSPQSPTTSKLANQSIGTVGHISRKRSKNISRSLQIPKTSKENIQTENQPPYFEVHTYRTRSKSASSSSQSPKTFKQNIQVENQSTPFRGPAYRTRSKSMSSSPQSPKTSEQNTQAHNQRNNFEGHMYQTRSKSASSSPQSPISRSNCLICKPNIHEGHPYQQTSKSASSSPRAPTTFKQNTRAEYRTINTKIHTPRKRSKSASSSSQSPKTFKQNIQTENQAINSEGHAYEMRSKNLSRSPQNPKAAKKKRGRKSGKNNSKAHSSQTIPKSVSSSPQSSKAVKEKISHTAATTSKSVSGPRSPKTSKQKLQARIVNSRGHISRKIQKKSPINSKSRTKRRESPKTKITEFLEYTPETKKKLGMKVDSPNKSSVGKTKRKLDFNKLEKESGDQLSNISNKKSLEPKKCSNSFRKYGIYVPSYQDILNEKEKYDKYAELVESLTKMVVPLPEIKMHDYDRQPRKIKVLNCKHLSKEDLFRAYEKNIKYLDDIISGNSFSERHEKYKSVAAREELTYNTSMITFTNEQKQLLVTDLCEKYGETSALSDYYFKVLLPELCLKIFMDEHSMSREAATEYLDCYPVEV